MTIAKLNTKAVAVAVALGLALSIALGFSVQSAGAQSMTMSQLVDLFIQLGIIAPDKAAAAKAAVTGSASTGVTFTRDLTVGSTGTDVTDLQVKLGVSPATGYFGSITKAAVTQYQAANGLPATGYFGPLTRAKMNASVVVTTPTTPTTPSTPVLSGSGEGYLDDVEALSRLSDEEVGEGEEDVEVLGVEVTAEDADQQIDRVIVEVDTPTGPDDLEDLVSDVSVWLDGKLLARMDVEDASYTRSDDLYSFRFTGLNGVVEEGETAELVVAVSGVNNIDDADSTEGWTVTLPENSIRAVSPNGVDDFYVDADISETFTVESFASANDVELRVSKDSSSPDTMTVEASESSETDGVEILVLNLRAEGSDIEVLDLPIRLTSTVAGVMEIANSVTIEIDGEEYSENIATTSAAAQDVIVTFDDLDLVIDEGDTVTVVVTVDVNEIDGNFTNGSSIKAEVDALLREYIEAEDQTGEDLESTDKKGTAIGEEISFFAEGISVEFVSATEVVSDSSDASFNDRGEYTIKFDVTAFGEDAYVASTTAQSTTDAGVVWDVTGAAFTGSATSNLTSSADESDTGNYLIEEGTTETFTLTVVLNNASGTPEFYGVEIVEVRFADVDDEDGALSGYTMIDSSSGLPDDLETEEEKLD